MLLAAAISGFALMLKTAGGKIEMGHTVLAGSPLIVLNQ